MTYVTNVSLRSRCIIKNSKETTMTKHLISIMMIIISGVILYFQSAFLFTYTKVPGEIIDVRSSTNSDNQRMYSPVIKFVDLQGKTQTHTPSSRSSWSPKIGSEKMIYIAPDGSGKVKIFEWIVILISVFFAFLGVAISPIWGEIIDKRRRKRLEEYKLYGDTYESDFVEVEHLKTSKGKKRGYIVHAQYHDEKTNELTTFKSHNILYDPTEFLTQEKIAVYCKQGNKRKYVMDLSFLPRHVNRHS